MCVMAVWWCCDAADSMMWVIEAAVVACAVAVFVVGVCGIDDTGD